MRSVRHPQLENPHCLSLNGLPPRATVIPAQRPQVFYRNKEDSDRLFSLNGDWDFLWKPEDLPVSDTDEWGTIDVPSVWQYRGYGKCLYPNVEYPIPFAPPYVLAPNPVGYYKRSFVLQKRWERTVLHFSGVDCAYYVRLNGQDAGFAKGSRCAHEFDVTALLREGENVIEVKVYAFSDSTYLENQDMLLASGIFRDVYLLFEGRAYLDDWYIQTDRRSVEITARVGGQAEGCRAEFTLDGVTLSPAPTAAGDGSTVFSCRFEPQSPREWNPEDPQTYDLVLRLIPEGGEPEYHTKRIGLRDIAIEGNKFLLNGHPMRFRGVNRHEYDPDNGRAVSVDFIRRELELIKAYNLNSIRCSHYTNNPAFYEFCTELGICVLDEADLESHGCGVTGDQGYLSKDPEWLDAYLDRTRRMAENDKNESCIVIWSIGNECGQGQNLEKCAEYLRGFCCKKPVMQVQDAVDGLPTYSDFRMRGYSTAMPPAMEQEVAREGAPVVLVEYEHGMGNGPGSLDEIWDYVYSHEECAGGWVWEFKGHGFHIVDKNGRDGYLYGGDFGDINSWSNFTLDGYLFSDGTPKPMMRELKEAYAPLRVRLEDNRVAVQSVRDFVSLEDLSAEWSLTADGREILRGSCPVPDLPPRSEGILMEVPALPERPAEYRLDLRFTDREGNRRASRQLELGGLQKPDAVFCGFAHDVLREGNRITVSGTDFAVGFEDGRLCRMEKDGTVLLDAPMELNLWRAPTDNDGIVGLYPRHIAEWDAALLWDMRFHPLQDELTDAPNQVCYRVDGLLQPTAKCAGFRIQLCYRVRAGGNVAVELEGTPFGNQMPDTLPRIGVYFPMDKSLDRVEWYGRGADESYPDRRLSTPFGVYASPVETLNVQYDVPQECGSHEDTRWLVLGNRLAFAGSDAFAFSYHDFSLADLTKARHRNELMKSDRNFLYIDYKMRGLGSKSCGPEPLEPYELHPHPFRLALGIAPGGADTAEALWRTRFAAKTEALGEAFVRPETFTRREKNECKE